MNLFGWLKRDPESRGMVRGRAVVIPHLPNVEMTTNSVESNFSANSVSTLGVTVRRLKPGESAVTVGEQYPRLPTTGMIRTTPVPPECQRLHVNVPNWMHLMIRQERFVYRLHAEIPVWIDPAKDKIWRIDKEKLMEEMEPYRAKGIEMWDRYGMVDGDPNMRVDSEEELGLEGLVEGWIGKVTAGVYNSAAASTTNAPSSPADFATDVAGHPPIEGVDFDKWVQVSAGLARDRVAPAGYDVYAVSKGVAAGRWEAIDAAWKQRMMADWKLGVKYGEAYEAAMKG